MKTCCKTIAAAALAMAAMPGAHAAVIATGSYAAGIGTGVNDSVVLGSGLYRFTLDLTGPAFVEGQVSKLTVFNDFCDPDGGGVVFCGGNDVPTVPLLEPAGANRYTARLRVDAPYTVIYPGGAGYGEYFDICCEYSFFIEGSEAGRYVFSYDAVPEPRAWALMILGFGAIGAAMRKRSALRVGLAPARA